MSDLINEIRYAQMRTAEDMVCADLARRGLTVAREPGQSVNAEQRQKFIELVLSVLQQINDIDTNTVADPRWPNEAPAWWLAMSKVRDECNRANRAA
jgi:hypothetical protein